MAPGRLCSRSNSSSTVQSVAAAPVFHTNGGGSVNPGPVEEPRPMNGGGPGPAMPAQSVAPDPMVGLGDEGNQRPNARPER